MENLIDVYKRLGPVRLAVLGGAVAVLLVLFATIMMQASKPQLSLLYGGLDQREASRIIELLDTSSVPYELRGGSIFVPQNQVGELRLRVAGEGLVGGGVQGYEIFDESSSFGTTSVVQNINARRALEGELARTIMSMPAVQTARVHLVMPKRRLFTTEDVQPTASVTLNIGNRLLGDEAVLSITHLVAAAVPGMQSGNVTVVDQRGNLLSSGQNEDALTGTLTSQMKIRQSFENKLERDIVGMLERVVGPGKADVKVNANLNFDRIEETAELFNPEEQVVRSEQRSESAANAQETNNNPAVGLTGNIPGEEGLQGTSVGSRENTTTTEETINYEISRTARRLVRETGAVQQLNVAILVEGRYVPDENNEGAQVYQPLTERELENMRRLVSTAIGYNEQRGDSLELVDMPFTSVPEVTYEEPLFSKDDYMQFAQLGAMVLAMLFIMLFVVRPIMKAAAPPPPPMELQPEGMSAKAKKEPQYDEDGNVIPGTGGDEDDEDVRISLENVKGKVRERALKQAKELIDSHSDQSVNVIRKWIGSHEQQESNF